MSPPGLRGALYETLTLLRSRFSARFAESPVWRGAATRLRPSWALPALVPVLALLTWPAWSSFEHLVIAGDAKLVHYPYQVLLRDSLREGRFPFWNPYTFGGIPAFPTLQAGYGYPLHWLLLPLPPVAALNWAAGLHLLLAGLSAAWCARRLGASPQGQCLSGLSFALGGALTARLWAGHLSWLEALAWLPLATALAATATGRRGFVVLAATIGMMALAGQPEVIIVSLWWLPLWTVFAAYSGGVLAVGRRLGFVALAAALGLALATFQLLPVVYLLGVSNRMTGMSWDFVTGASIPSWYLLEGLALLVFGDPRGGYWPGPAWQWHERLFYVGLAPLAAAALASGRWKWASWCAALIAVGLSLGKYGVFFGWAYSAFPGYSTMRIPSRHLALAALAVSLGAAHGLDRLHGRKIAVALICLSAGLFLVGLHPTEALIGMAWSFGGGELLASLQANREAELAMTGALHRATALGLLLALACLFPRKLAYGAVLLLTAAELTILLSPFRLQDASPEVTSDPAIRSLATYGRAAVLGDSGAILASHGPVLRLEQPAGYLPLHSSGYALLVTGNPNPGVAFDVAPGTEPILDLLGYGATFDMASRRLTVSSPPPPLAWVAHCVRPGGAREVRERDFPRRSCITLSGATQAQAAVSPGHAEVLSRGAGTLRVEADGPGWLVTVEPWYPGWRVWIDGVPGRAEVVDGALVGVDLPPGRHLVELQYIPAGLESGLAISVSALLVLAIIWGLPSAWGHLIISAVRKRSL